MRFETTNPVKRTAEQEEQQLEEDDEYRPSDHMRSVPVQKYKGVHEIS